MDMLESAISRYGFPKPIGRDLPRGSFSSTPFYSRRMIAKWRTDFVVDLRRFGIDAK